MLAVEQLVETERRYKARTDERLAAERAIGESGILYADSPERVRRRLARLAQSSGASTMSFFKYSGPHKTAVLGQTWS